MINPLTPRTIYAGTYGGGVFKYASSSTSILPEDSIHSSEMPAEFALFQNYPNPFNEKTIIRYQTPESGHIDIVIYNLLGEKIAELVHERKSAGYHTVHWDGEDYSGTGVASGLYFCKIRMKSFAECIKMLVLR
jgi:hypothetical protein